MSPILSRCQERIPYLVKLWKESMVSLCSYFSRENSIAWWWLCTFVCTSIMSHFLRLVLYQVRDLWGIKVGHCVVSSPIYVLMYWGGGACLWSVWCKIGILCCIKDWSLCCIKTMDLCCIKSILVLYQVNDLIDGTLCEWASNYDMEMSLYDKSCGYTMWYIACHGHWVLKVSFKA